MMMIADSGAWSLGTLIALPIGASLAVGLFALGVWWLRRPSWDDFERLLPGWAAIVGGVLAATFTAIGMFPYSGEYHQWRQVSGEVQSVEARLVADGEGMSERYVVMIDGQPFGIDDTRAALLSEGDQVALTCKREWVYSSLDGYGCRWSE